MKNKIIWVFGPSAVGKETFIKYIYKNKPVELLNRLGWNNKNIIICNESLNWVVQAEDDGNESFRKNLNLVIEKYSKNNLNSIILVKGQDLDFSNNHLKKVKESLIDDKHEIVFLFTNFEVLYDRYKNKKWWDKSMTKDVCKSWAQEQLNYLIKYQDEGFKIIALDSGGDNKYLDINFPPTL